LKETFKESKEEDRNRGTLVA